MAKVSLNFSLKAMRYIKTLNIFLLILTAYLSGERNHLCSLVSDYVVMDFSSAENRYDNGYKEERYHYVLDSLIEEFSVDIAPQGGTLHILRDWGDGSVNAWAWRMGKEYWLEVPGGMARYYLISEEGFLTTLCHELGHLLGGSPHSSTISYEGQADYYSTMKCMERILKKLGSPKSLAQEIPSCEGDYCGQRFLGVKSLTSYYAELEKVPAPSLGQADQRTVRKTQRKHPGSQCRFDTMVASLRCDNREEFAFDNPWRGSCPGPGSRPRCWFNPEEFPAYN